MSSEIAVPAIPKLAEPSDRVTAGGPSLPVSGNGDAYRIGTLRYTKAGLIVLFAWLLWGDFCLTLMEAVVPGILPIKLRDIGADNVLIGILLGTVPSALNLMINPIISFRSDRFRSRFGRRIPFLLIATPPLTICLIMLGFSESIASWFHALMAHSPGQAVPLAVTLSVIALFVVLFQCFNMVVSSLYYYLLNDVVPVPFMARFMALFRVVGTAGGSLFHFFVFPHAQTHMREIFLAAGVLYFIAFIGMCLRVKEGAYPPPPPNLQGRRGFLAAARTYAVECYSHRFYRSLFFANAFWATAWVGGPFVVYMHLSIGLDLKVIGQINGWSSVLSMLLLYPAGMLADKIHPLRMVLLAAGLQLIVYPTFLIWLVVSPTPTLALYVTIAQTALMLPLGVMYTAAVLPMYMRLLPKERYGQFGSADAIVRSLLLIGAGPAIGYFMNVMKNVYAGDAFYYRYSPIWALAFQILSIICLIRVYRYWRANGGSRGEFVPPQGNTTTQPVVRGT